MNRRRKISVGKVIADLFIIGGVAVTGKVIIDDVTRVAKREHLEAGAPAQTVVVEERNFGGSNSVEYAIPVGNTSFKSYMDYRALTNTDSAQYHLQEGCWTDDTGLRRYGDDYVIAMGSYYAKYIGERFTITLDSGEEFTAVVGDFKADRHTDRTNRYTACGEGNEFKNIIEFVVDTELLPKNVRKMGDVSCIDGFEGNIRSIEKE